MTESTISSGLIGLWLLLVVFTGWVLLMAVQSEPAARLVAWLMQWKAERPLAYKALWGGFALVCTGLIVAALFLPPLPMLPEFSPTLYTTENCTLASDGKRLYRLGYEAAQTCQKAARSPTSANPGLEADETKINLFQGGFLVLALFLGLAGFILSERINAGGRIGPRHKPIDPHL